MARGRPWSTSASRVETELSAAGWAALRTERPLSDGSLVTRAISWDGQVSGILVGMDAVGELYLLIPMPDTEVRRTIADLNGLRVRPRVTEAGPYLSLTAEPQHERVFTPVCREIVQAVFSNGREPWAAVDSVIRQWLAAWRAIRPAMSRPVQIGLVGELIILARVMIPALGAAAILSWSGAERERHDFIAGLLHIEVKTTTRNRHEHEISRLDQLWIGGGAALVLASVRLEATIGGDTTVATMVDEVLHLAKDEPGLADAFLVKLSKLDWSDDMRRSGELLSFNLSEAAFYEVDADFPRLTESFTPPAGIVAVRYTISLANLPTLDLDEVYGLLGSAVAPT